MINHKNLIYSILFCLFSLFISVILADYNGGSSFGEKLLVALLIVVPPVLGINFALRGMHQEGWKVFLFIAFLLNLYQIVAIILPVVIKLFN